MALVEQADRVWLLLAPTSTQVFKAGPSTAVDVNPSASSHNYSAWYVSKEQIHGIVEDRQCFACVVC